MLFDNLGMPISEAFAQIEQQPSIYDVVHVKYYEEVSDFKSMDFFFVHTCYLLLRIVWLL